MRFAPNACRFPITLLLKPVTIETMAITVVTPTTMPRTVSPERSLCSRRALNANRMFSKNPRRKVSIKRFMPVSSFPSFEPERLDRRQLGSRGRRREAREQAGHGRGRDADQHERGLDLRRKDLTDG